MKAGFPLPAAEVSRVFDALGVLAPPLTRDAYTLDQFLAELVEPSDAVRVVRVHKRRQRYTLANCMAEVADLEVDGRVARTIAVESEDPSAVIAAVRRVGLDGQVNTSYPRPCGTDGRWTPRYAVIDVGTNSVKFHIAERDPDGSWRAIVDRAELTRLGEASGTRERSRPSRWSGRWPRSPTWSRRPTPPGAGDRRGRDRRVADRPQPRGGHRGDPDPHRDHRGGDLGRGGEPAGLPRGAGRAGRDRGVAGRLRHRRWQQPVHLRPRPAGRGALQRQCRGGPLHRAGSPGRWHPSCWARPLPRSPPTWPASMAAPRRMPWWGWAGR